MAADIHPSFTKGHSASNTFVFNSSIFQFLHIVVIFKLQFCVLFADFMCSPAFDEQKRTMCI